ncbi:MAG TPA: hypothetical protein VFB45_10400 [Pseudolabrys sp.]|nr:hypothetical protein [Pseudolabrys sp.]
MWERLKKGFRHSVTILWARLVALTGVALAVATALATDPAVTGAVQGALDPKYVPYYVIAIGIVTELCRRRTAVGADERKEN